MEQKTIDGVREFYQLPVDTVTDLEISEQLKGSRGEAHVNLRIACNNLVKAFARLNFFSL